VNTVAYNFQHNVYGKLSAESTNTCAANCGQTAADGDMATIDSMPKGTHQRHIERYSRRRPRDDTTYRLAPIGLYNLTDDRRTTCICRLSCHTVNTVGYATEAKKEKKKKWCMSIADSWLNSKCCKIAKVSWPSNLFLCILRLKYAIHFTVYHAHVLTNLH